MTRRLFSIQAIVLGIALGWGWLRQIPWWTHLHLDLGVLLGMAVGVGLAEGSHKLFTRLTRPELEWYVNQFLKDIFGGLPLATLFLLAMASGLAEEALFRGVLVKEFGLVSSSLVFGLLHAGDRRLWLASLWSAGVGLGLGALYLATGNLTHCVAIHASSNLASFLALRKTQASSL